MLKPSVAIRVRNDISCVWITLLLMPFVVAGCRQAAPVMVVPGGDPERGRTAVVDFRCGVCHAIPGVPDADGRIGPPLNGIAERALLAGEVPNLPANMVQWIQDPPSIEPKTAMPNLRIDARTARDIAAYLYTLR